MITSITGKTRVLNTGAVNKQITFAMAGNEYLVVDVAGLGPPKSDVNRVDTANDPGSDYLSTRMGERNIVITMEFKPNYSANSTVSALRRKLYEVFMPGNKVDLEFLTDDMGTLKITGHVETHNPVIFSANPAVQISIICPKPEFRDINDIFTTFTLPGTQTFSLTSPSFIPVGFEFEATLDTTASSVALFLQPNGTGYMMLSYPFVSGDRLKFSSIQGSRSVTMTRASATTNMMGYFTGSLVDCKLLPGSNTFRCNEYDRFSSATIKYKTIFGGI